MSLNFSSLEFFAPVKPITFMFLLLAITIHTAYHEKLGDISERESNFQFICFCACYLVTFLLFYYSFKHGIFDRGI